MVSESWKVFLNQHPTDEREFRTIEIFHPDFTSVLRFVSDYEDQTLKLESTAPRNPGENVLFTALSLVINEPTVKGNSSPLLTVNMGAIGNEVQDELDNVTDDGFFTPVSVIYRRYYEGETDGPVLIYNLSAASLKFQSYKGVAFTAQDIDYANRAAGEVYTVERFEGLSGI